MKYIIAVVLISSSIHFSFSQNGVFDKYDFSTGKYNIQGVYLQEHDFPNIADSIGDFLIGDLKTLKWCKSNWKTTDSAERYIEFYTYRIDVLEDKQAVESFWVNLIDNVIRTNKGTYQFDNSLFLKMRNNLTPIEFNKVNYTSITEARAELDNLIKNDSIVSYWMKWEHFEGEFTVTTPYDENYISSEDSYARIEAELNKQFPEESFKLSYSGSYSWGEEFSIKCSKRLFSNFEGKKSDWEPYDPIVYLRIKK